MNAYKISVGKTLKGKDHLEVLDVDVRIILKGTQRKRVWAKFNRLSVGSSGGLF
jgi:hypothetical protein